MRAVRGEVYRDRRGEWRWRLRHQNGRVLADSGEGYGRRSRCTKALRRLGGYFAGGDLLILSGDTA